MKIQLKRSNQLEGGSAKEPSVDQMEYGELAVNYNSSDPVIFLKDSSDSIIRITGSEEQIPPGDGQVTLNMSDGTPVGSFTVNQSNNTTLTIPYSSGGSGGDADTLNGQNGAYYLNYNNFTNTPFIPTDNSQIGNGAGYITLADVPSGGNANDSTISFLDFANASLGSFTTNQASGSNISMPFLRRDVSYEQSIASSINIAQSVYVQHQLSANNSTDQVALTATADNNGLSGDTTCAQLRCNNNNLNAGNALRVYTYPDQITRATISKYGDAYVRALYAQQSVTPDFNWTSDQKYKQNISPYTATQLIDIKELGASIKTFYWKTNAPVSEQNRSELQIGLIAQEVEAIDPSVVETITRVIETPAEAETLDENGNYESAGTWTQTEEEYKTISLNKLMVKLLGGMAELIQKNEELEERIQTLETSASS